MPGKVRKGLSFLMAFIFIVSSLLLVERLYDDQKAAKLSEAAQEQVIPVPDSSSNLSDEPTSLEIIPVQDPLPLESIPVEEEETRVWEPLGEDYLFLMEMDLDALRKTSENVLGWIYIPDSVVNYPLMTFTDNETGLHQAWDGTKSSSGCIFIECKNQRDFNDFNTIIYGHNMLREEMFGTLKYFAQPEYLNSHNMIYIVTDDYVRRYEIFSAYEANIVSDTYRLYFANEEMKQTALNYYMESTDVETSTEPTIDDRILTLSTCMDIVTNDTRWVVQAVLNGEFCR